MTTPRRSSVLSVPSVVQTPRSPEQNAYYWAVVLPYVADGMTDAWGETIRPTDAHRACKRLFLSKPIYNAVQDKIIGHTEPSTANLDTRAFAEYLDQIHRLAAEFLHIEIPSPTPKQGNPA